MNLILGNPLASSSQLQDHLSILKTTETAFEQPHRLSSLASNSFSSITSAIPPFKTLDPETLKGCLLVLVPNGSITMTELMTRESSDTFDLQKLNIQIPSISQRRSELIMAGFTSIEIIREENACLGDFSHLEYDTEGEQVLLKLVKVTLKALKPDFVVGASAKLRFGNNSKKIWKISALSESIDEDLEFENDEALLDEEDLKLPSTKVSLDANCETRKKPCKNCTCGRLEEYALDSQQDQVLQSKITIVESTITKKNLPVSSCGSCYLGDAFRCSTCPYLGMPAFKEGEKVLLSGNLLTDDL